MRQSIFVAAVLSAGLASAQSPSVQVHVVEQRAPKAGHLELTLYPASVQMNGSFTQHVGTFGAATWHVRERFALQLLGGGNWHNGESQFNAELVDKFRVEAQAAESLLWTWGVFGGVEVEPFFAKFTLFNGPLVHVGVVLGGGAGAGGTRHQLRPELTARPASYGNTGVRFMGTLAAGFRLQIGERFTARLEVRDVAYSARVDTVNGCAQAQLEVSRCGLDDDIDRHIARNLVRLNSSAVLHNVGFYWGGGFTF